MNGDLKEQICNFIKPKGELLLGKNHCYCQDVMAELLLVFRLLQRLSKIIKSECNKRACFSKTCKKFEKRKLEWQISVFLNSPEEKLVLE